MSCGIGHRRGLNPVSRWLWCRPAAAALIRPLAWEPPNAMGAALKRPKTKKKKQKKNLALYEFFSGGQLFYFIFLTLLFPPKQFFFPIVQHGDPVIHTCIHTFFSIVMFCCKYLDSSHCLDFDSNFTYSSC